MIWKRIARTQGARVSGVDAARTSRVELSTTDATNIVLGDLPRPGGDSLNLSDRDLHFDVVRRVVCGKARRVGDGKGWSG
jgi:hypothetical protein